MSTLKVGTIQDHANSITAMSIDSSGRVTVPQRICFAAQYKTGGGGASVGDVLIVFNTDINYWYLSIFVILLFSIDKNI